MVIIFCGVPGSGKSTIAKGLAKKIEKLGLRPAHHPPTKGGPLLKIFISDQISGRIYEKIFKFLKENSGKADFILIDATFYKKKWRDMVYKIAKEKNEKVFMIYLYCLLKTCLERNEERRPKIPEKAVHIIYHQIEKPKRPDIAIGTDKVKPKEAVLKILQKIKEKS